MHRFCICGHKAKAHNDVGICGVCECDYFRAKSVLKVTVKLTRRTPEASKRVMKN